MSNPKVLVATLLCDRLKYSANVAPPQLYKLTYPQKTIYLNIQTNDYDKNFPGIKDLVKKNLTTRTEIDTWDLKSSTWWKSPTFSQDQARLVPICIARNMAVDCALLGGYDFLFFVDADVIVPSNSIERLMSHNKPLISGTVPGRGMHGYMTYVFHQIPGASTRELTACAHATCGFTLIKRELFEVLRFRQGPHPIKRDVHLSEDPAFGADAECIWKITDHWYVDNTLMAAHLDDPENPLTPYATAQF